MGKRDEHPDVRAWRLERWLSRIGWVVVVAAGVLYSLAYCAGPH